MKVAFCLFGMPRRLDDTIDQYVALAKDCDVFSHMWGEKHELLDRFNLKSFLNEPLYDTRAHAFIGVFAPENLKDISNIRKSQGLEGFNRYWDHPGWRSVPVNATSMWHSMSKSVSLALEYECRTGIKYDRIVLLRTDLVFQENFELSSIHVGDVHKFMMPSFHPGSRIDLWIPDQVLSMSRNAARLMTTLLQSSYHYYFACETPEIPEIMLGVHMYDNQMTIATSGLHYSEAYKFYHDAHSET